MKLVIFILFLLPTLALGSVTVTVNGSNHTIPQTNERGWGNAVTAWIQAISSNTLQPTGGSFILTSNVDFGANYGLKAPYYLSRTANPASLGLFRLSKTDVVAWRNNANSGDLSLGINGSDALTFGSVVVPTVSSTATLTNKTIDATLNSISNISNAEIKSGAAIAVNKLEALTPSKVLVTDGSGFASASSTSSTTLSYLDVSSSVQTQLNAKEPTITTLGIARGGTGQATASAAFDALSPNTTKGDITVRSTSTNTRLAVGADGTVLTADSAQTLGVKWSSVLTNPMTTSGDIIYGGASGTATRLAKGSDGQLLTLSSGIPAWTSFVPSMTVTSQSTNYTAAINDLVLVSAAATITLPTAVGNSGKMIGVVNTSTTAANVTINTTSSQTVSGRASGDIILRRHNNYVLVMSNGTNWNIIGKLEHEVKASSATSSINGPTNSYQSGSPSVSLGIGEWEVECSFAIYGGSSGVDVQVFDTSGLFQADGANTTTAPTAISSQVDTGNSFNYGGYGITTRVTAFTTSSPTFRTRIIVTSGTQTVYAVPNILYSTAGTGNAWVAKIWARRIF